MQNKVPLYWQLLHNKTQLTALYQCGDIDDFVQYMALYLQWPELTFKLLLSFLELQNKTFLRPELKQFSSLWQPAEYKKNQRCLTWIPAFEPLQKPFYQEDMLLQRGRLLAQFIKPVTLVCDLLAQADALQPVSPDLIIFHWSRCGSTLLAGLYRRLSGVKLLSESMLISDMLSDPYWPEHLKPDLLQLSVSLQGCFRHCETLLVMKLNAWDLQLWPLWLQLFPAARVLCLGRDPVAILASHQRTAGIHMAAVKGIWQQQDLWKENDSTLLGRIRVMRLLLFYTKQLLSTGQADYVDYQMVQQAPQSLAAYLARELTVDEQQQWQDCKRRNAKQPDVVFQQSQSPQLVFSAMELQLIRNELSSDYDALTQRS